jgi:hypothetical protein
VKADQLFAGETPPPPPADPTAPILRLLWIALPLNLLGPCLFTGVPGAALSLWAWYRADEELARLEAGAHPVALKSRLSQIRWFCSLNLGLCGALLLLQLGLFGIGAYQALLQALVGEAPV